MKRLSYESLIPNLKEKEAEMAYQQKPQFPAVEQGNVGDKVVLEGVKIAYLFDLAQGNGWTRQDMKVESIDGSFETKVKQWRPERVFNVGEVVTVVGTVEEYQGKKSLSVDAKKGGGIAADGEPLARVDPTPSAPVRATHPQPPASGKRSFLIFFYADVLKKFHTMYEDEVATAAAVHSVMISYNRGELSEEELSRWLDNPEDDIPF